MAFYHYFTAKLMIAREIIPSLLFSGHSVEAGSFENKINARIQTSSDNIHKILTCLLVD